MPKGQYSRAELRARHSSGERRLHQVRIPWTYGELFEAGVLVGVWIGFIMILVKC
jgi:hypothetical protein